MGMSMLRVLRDIRAKATVTQRDEGAGVIEGYVCQEGHVHLEVMTATGDPVAKMSLSTDEAAELGNTIFKFAQQAKALPK